MKKKLILALPVLLLALNLPFVRVLSISNRKNFSERIYSLEAAKTGFVISYTHSVNKGRVHDFYRATDSGMLELFMTEFVSYGAGIPEAQETPGSKFSVTDKGYVISDLHRTLPSLLMAVGVVAEHSVSVGKEALDGMSFTESNEFFLKNFFKPQTSLVFEIKRMSVLGLLMAKKI